MPLVLGMNLEKDNEVYLDDLRVTIDRILNPTQIQITVHGEYMVEQKVVNDLMYCPVHGKTEMMLGKNTNKNGFVRLLVQAPQSVKIKRGAIYER